MADYHATRALMGKSRNVGERAAGLSKSSAKNSAVKRAKPKKRLWQLPSAKSEGFPGARAPANPTGFAILFIAANSQLQSPSAEDDVLSSVGRD
jgi:hypothetical protein